LERFASGKSVDVLVTICDRYVVFVEPTLGSSIQLKTLAEPTLGSNMQTFSTDVLSFAFKKFILIYFSIVPVCSWMV